MLYRKTISMAVGLACATMSGLTFAQQAETPKTGADANAATTTLPAVNVTATTSATTENSGSYGTNAVTIGSKIPTSIRETPFSVSVVTRQQLDDQNLTKIEDALKQTTGITIYRTDGGGNFNTIMSRGFNIGSIQLDGVAISQDTNFATGFDTAIYDRIEVLRGPSGLLQGAGEPGGTIGLARKRARSEFGGSVGASVGSWDARRAEFDITGKLDQEGRIRARVVGVVDHRDSFVDVVESDKNLAYGTLEFDLAPQTTLSVGATTQRVDSVLDQGLPAYVDGRLPDLSRSTFIGTDSNVQDMKNSDIFAELEHHLDNGGLMKLSMRQTDREMYYFGGRGAVPLGATLLLPPGYTALQRTAWDRQVRNRNLDAYVTSPFELGGRKHQLLLGMNYSTEESTGDSISFSPLAAPVLPVDVFNPVHDIALPPIPLGPTDPGVSHTGVKQTQRGIYGQFQFKPTDNWTLLLGGRLSRWETRSFNPVTGMQPNPASKPGTQFTPQVGAIYALDDHSSVYASYAETFVGQTAVDINKNVLSPRTGSQVELGINSEWLQKRLNTHLALFQILDKDRAIADPTSSVAGVSIAGGEVRSQGLEAEISGQIRPGWEIVAGYAYTETKYLKAPANQDGLTFSPVTPKHIFNLWSKHTWRDGTFNRWSLAGGLRAVSDFYDQVGTVRVNGDGYTTVNLQIGYEIDPKTVVSLTVTNLLDEKYYEKVQANVGRQNFYGEPQAVTLALRKSF